MPVFAVPKNPLLRLLPTTPRGHAAALVVAMAIALLLTTVLFTVFRQQIESRTRASLETIAVSQRDAIGIFLHERLQDTALLAQRNMVQDYLVEHVGNPAHPPVTRGDSVHPDMAAEMTTVLNRMQAVYGYHDIQVLAPDLRVLMSLKAEALEPQELEALRRVAGTRQQAFVDMHLHADGKAYFGVAGPVLEGGVPGGRLVGLVYLEVEAEAELFPLMGRWPLELRTGETLLFRREGPDRVRYLSELRFAPGVPPLSLVKSTTTYEDYVPGRLRGGEELLTYAGTDYRGRKVLVAVASVPGTGWFLEAKIDHEEYLAPVLRLLITTVLLLVFILGLLALVAWLSLRGQRAEIDAAKAAHDARYAAARRASLDGYIEIDDQGTIVDVNPTLAEMLGRTREDLVLKPLVSIEAARNALELEAALEALRAKGAERFRTRLWHRSGRAVDVEISASYLPVPEGGSFFGTIHDIGPELAARARIERLGAFYAFLSQANAAIFNLRDAHAILEAICRSAVSHGGMVAVRAGLVDAATGGFRVVAAEGAGAAEVLALHLPIEPAEAGPMGLIRRAMAERRILYANDFVNDELTAPWHEEGRRQGIHAAALVPVLVKERAVGVLAFYAPARNYFDAEFRAVLEEVAFNVALAIEAATAMRERDRMQAELERSELQLRRTFDGSPIPVMVFALESRKVIMVNRAFERLLAYTLDDVPDEASWSARAYPDPAVRAGLHAHWERAVATARDGAPGTVVTSPEVQLLCGDGTVRTMRGVMSVNVDTIVLQWEDLTDIRAAEQALHESEQGFRSLIEETFTGVYVHQDDRIVYVNPRMTDLTGWSTGELLGRDSMEFFEHDPEVAAAVRRARDELAGGRRNVALDLSFMGKEGRPIPLSFHVAVTTWNKRPAVVAMVHDISERKRSEERIAAYVKQLERITQGTLQAVSIMVEMRDPYTAGHQRRVGLIAADIGRELGWDEERCRWLAEVGMVHDIGKVGVPAEILSKPGRLTELERSLVQDHAQKGYEILRVVDFPLPLADIVHQHHERLDGSGYPQGLKGEEILPEARVLAVADVLESMASHRPYRASLGSEVALAELERHAGSWFDPVVVATVARMVREQGYRLPE